MKIAVINFSGNVGKTTIARHLLAPRLPGAAVVSIESLNADDTTTDTLRANQFGALQEYLQTVVPMVHGVERRQVGPMETLEFRQDMAGAKHPWRFLAQNMSDGTLRALGVLVALFQGNQDYAPTLVGIEEPETALHPAASAALREALIRASSQTQIIVTSHSPDLLDDRSLSVDSFLAVVSEGGETRIAPLDQASRDIMRQQLFSAGELLRLNQLAPDRTVLAEREARQADLFGEAQP